MPEGDTLYRLARALRPRLEGRGLVRLCLRDRGPVEGLAGARVREVAALGKHLLLALHAPDAAPADWVLHVHLGMRGRVQRRDPAPDVPGRASFALDTERDRILGRDTARCELLRRIDVASHPQLSRLGPDLLAPPVPFSRIARRARRRAPRRVDDLLLDQTVACGIGNVYKSEVLFAEGVAPGTRVAALSDAALGALYRRAALLLSWNLEGGRRNTVRRVTPRDPLRGGEPRSFVYGRAGRPCLRCGGRVAVARSGDGARATFWCPGCQPAQEGADERTRGLGYASGQVRGGVPR